MPPLVALRLSLHAAVLAILCGAIASAADAPPKTDPASVSAPGGDRSVIYKFDPLSKKFTAVKKGDLKPQHVYHRWSPSLDRWVWSKLAADGTLRFAFGPGSSQPAALFDMPANSEERSKAFEKQSPELAKRLAINGAKPSLRLGENGQWSLMPDATKGRVFDLESGQRFEWHGSNVVPVTHGTSINRWIHADGRYQPVGGKPFSIPPSYGP